MHIFAVALLVPPALAGAAPAAGAAPRLDRDALTCEACILIDDAGAVLFARNAAQPMPNASTTKMATALVVLDHAEPDEMVSVSGAAASTGGGGVDLDEGDRATVRDLLIALMLSSSNDAAVALAEHVAGTEAAFVARMNRYVTVLGAGGTEFVTPHGLDRPGHVSTAADLALLGGAVLEHPLLAAMVATADAEIEVSGRPVEVENRNLLLESYSGAIGIKTGFTAGAGNVLVGAARRGGRTLIAVAMGSVDAAADSRALLDFGFETLARTVLVDLDRDFAALVFPEGATSVRPLRRMRGPQRPEAVALQFSGEPRAPLLPGEVVGDVVVSTHGGDIGRVPAVVTDAVEDGDVPWVVSLLVAVVRAAAVAAGRGA